MTRKDFEKARVEIDESLRGMNGGWDYFRWSIANSKGAQKRRMIRAFRQRLEEDEATLVAYANRLDSERPRIDAAHIRSPRDFGPLRREAGGTYPITCPYCFARFHVNELLFRAAVLDPEDENPYNSFPMEEDEEYRRHWHDAMHMKAVDSRCPHILKEEPFEGEIRDIIFMMPDGTQTQPIPYDDPDIERMRSVCRVVRLHDKFGNMTDKRICPYCHTELPFDIGFVPNYIFTLMGDIGSGKTVYLNRLICSLTDNMLRDRQPYHAVIANEESGNYNSGTYERARRVFECSGETMIRATEHGYVRPVILKLDRLAGGVGSFYITLFDFPGEGMWTVDNQHFRNLAIRNFENSFGWLFLFDSGTLPFVRENLPPAERSDNTGRSAGHALPAAIFDQVVREFGSGAPFAKPVAFILAKSDLIRECVPQLVGSHLMNEPTFLRPARPHQCADLADMYACDTEIRRMLYTLHVCENADPLCRFNCSWFAVSSTNVPVENGILPEDAGTGAVSGLRELQPLEWLLYRWGQMDSECSEGSRNEVLNWARRFQADPHLVDGMAELIIRLRTEIQKIENERDNL